MRIVGPWSARSLAVEMLVQSTVAAIVSAAVAVAVVFAVSGKRLEKSACSSEETS